MGRLLGVAATNERYAVSVADLLVGETAEQLECIQIISDKIAARLGTIGGS